MGDVAKIICVGGSFEINISLGLTEKQYSFQFKYFFDLSLNLIHNQNFKIGE